MSNQEIETAGGLLRTLACLIDEVLHSTSGDIFIRARTVGYLASIGLKACETASLEIRLARLEEAINGGGDGQHRA